MGERKFILMKRQTFKKLLFLLLLLAITSKVFCVENITATNFKLIYDGKFDTVHFVKVRDYDGLTDISTVELKEEPEGNENKFSIVILSSSTDNVKIKYSGTKLRNTRGKELSYKVVFSLNDIVLDVPRTSMYETATSNGNSTFTFSDDTKEGDFYKSVCNATVTLYPDTEGDELDVDLGSKYNADLIIEVTT